jgi:iron(III) transport system substrate-binding protein
MKIAALLFQAISSMCFCLSLPLLSAAQSAKPGWQTEWEKTVEAAKQEGKVVVSIPTSAELRKALEAGFQKEFAGIDLELSAARGASNINKIVEEQRAGVHRVDLHMGGTSSIITGLLAQNLLEPLQTRLILPQVREAKNWWSGHLWADSAHQYVYSFLAYLTETLWYNSNRVKAENITSYDDLLDPRWKGEIAILDPRTPGSGESTWAFLWRIKGENYLRRLVGQELLVGRNLRQLAEALVKGKVSLSIGVSYYTYLPFIKAGLPVKPLPAPKEGIYASTGSGNIVMLKNAPHPNAAKVFLNWLLSRDGQLAVSKALGQPTRRLDVDTQWTKEFGHVAAKEALTPEKFAQLENQSEEVVKKVREPAAALARKLLEQ